MPYRRGRTGEAQESGQQREAKGEHWAPWAKMGLPRPPGMEGVSVSPWAEERCKELEHDHRRKEGLWKPPEPDQGVNDFRGKEGPQTPPGPDRGEDDPKWVIFMHCWTRPQRQLQGSTQRPWPPPCLSHKQNKLGTGKEGGEWRSPLQPKPWEGATESRGKGRALSHVLDSAVS